MNKIKVAIIGGSGIDNPEILKNFEEIDIDTTFGKPSGKLISGQIKGQDVVVLARHGKDHSIMPTKVPFRANIQAIKELGCTHILATTACGSLQKEIKPKDLVFLDQFIDFTKLRNLTFHEDKVVHTSMADPFCAGLRQLLVDVSKDLNLSYHQKGTIITVEGPRFSTRAESRMFRMFGADVINMSTVPEVILARECGICYASIAMVTDYDCWKENEEPVTWDTVLKTMEHNSGNVKQLLLELIPKIGFFECPC